MKLTKAELVLLESAVAAMILAYRNRLVFPHVEKHIQPTLDELVPLKKRIAGEIISTNIK